MEELDWLNNKDAIGCFVSNGGRRGFYVKTKELSNYTSGELTDGWQGFDVYGNEYHVFAKYWDWIENPANVYTEGTLLEVEEPTSGNELGMDRPDINTRKLGKVQMELVDTGFPNALYAIGRVMTWAAENKGYKPNDWKNLPDSFMAFTGAASRHRIKRLKGEELDDESGLLHLTHEAFNILALLETTLLEDKQ